MLFNCTIFNEWVIKSILNVSNRPICYMFKLFTFILTSLDFITISLCESFLSAFFVFGGQSTNATEKLWRARARVCVCLRA